MKCFYISFILLFLFTASCNLKIGFVATSKDSLLAENVSDQYKADIIRLNYKELIKLIDNNSNRVILIHLWACWCKPCVEELPDIKLLHDKYFDKGLSLILLSNDLNSASQDQIIRNTLVKSGVSFDTYITDISTFRKITNIDGSASKLFKHITSDYNGGIPLNVILDKSGKVVFERGLTPYDTLESIILPLLVSDTNSR